MTSLAVQPRAAPVRRRWDKGVPPSLRPLVRAYLLGYATTITPRLFTWLLRCYVSKAADLTRPNAGTPPTFSQSLLRILHGGLKLRAFPTFCALLVGGSRLLEIPISAATSRLSASHLDALVRQRLSRFLSTFCAAWLSLKLLQSKRSDASAQRVPARPDDAQPPSASPDRPIEYAGRTLDLSLFAFTRALDVIVGELWAQRQPATSRWRAKLESTISRLTDPTIFAVSCTFIMWAWFYYPSRLPQAYGQWISKAAAVDPRLIEALRGCRKQEILYGQDTGQAPLLQAMARDYGWPLDWGDPAKSIPYPCDMVHMGCGPSCELHALSRFWRSFRWSMATYVPLNLLLVVRNPRLKAVRSALHSAVRSSAFLAAFITFFFYGVCLTRTRVGPHLLGHDVASRNRIDGGLCVGSGCFLCGWSILIEAPGRRKDMGLFVAPRAMATLLPRRYALDKQWRETLVFAASTGVVFACSLENPRRVRGFLGKVLETVLTP